MASQGNELGDLEELQSFMDSLSEKLEKAPYDYGTYTRWIELLRPVGDIGSLRVARESMLRNIAAPAELWLRLIEDEKSQPDALQRPESIATIRDLFERATAEYMSVSMWQRYIDFVKELEASDNANMRSAAAEAFESENYLFSVLQGAVNATSYHFTEGQALWISYKEYIEQMLQGSDHEQSGALLELLKTIYLQRLGQPHAQLESTFSMYSGFVTKFTNQDYERQMVEANSIVSGVRKACSKRDDYETELASSGNSWSAFQLYIDRLAKDKSVEPKEITTLYERCLALHCYMPEIWDEYLTYVARLPAVEDIDAQDTGTGSDFLHIAGRAVRNCPWSGKIWAQLSYATFARQGYTAADAVYEQAMSTHAVDYSMAEYAKLAMARINIARLALQRLETGAEPDVKLEPQELGQICRSCLDTAYTMPMETADPQLWLERCCTTLVASVSQDIACAREMWTRICKSRKVCAEAWVLSAEFEREYGSMDNARNVYRHASQRRLDNSERVFGEWIAFEHCFGDLSTLRAAEGFINAQRHLEWRRLERESYAAHNGALQQEVAPSAVASTAEAVEEAGDPGLAAAKRKKRKRSDASAIEESAKTHIETDGEKAVFVSGLPLSFKKEDVDALFDNIKSAKGIEMLMDKQGEFRGQAKVTLASGEEMIAALDKNGQKAEGSFISVHVFKQRGKDGTQGRPSLPNRARKAAREVVVRVTGFSPETGNKQLEAIAKGSGGTVVRVRRNQQGDVAFVAMKSLSDAQGAVEALNGCLVQGATLAAAVDGDGQAAQGRAAGPQGQSASLSASAKDMPMKAKAASNAAIGLVPRKASSNRRPAKRINVAKNAMPAVSEPEGQAAPGSTTDAGPSEDHAPADPSNTQTNADFRNLFLGQGSSSEKQ